MSSEHEVTKVKWLDFTNHGDLGRSVQSSAALVTLIRLMHFAANLCDSLLVAELAPKIT